MSYNPHAHSKRLKSLDFKKTARGSLARPDGFFTTARWSLFADKGRYSFTGDLMNRARSLEPHVFSPWVTGFRGLTQ